MTDIVLYDLFQLLYADRLIVYHSENRPIFR